MAQARERHKQKPGLARIWTLFSRTTTLNLFFSSNCRLKTQMPPLKLM